MIDIATIFRSIVNFKDSSNKETISQENLVKNFRALQEHTPEVPEEKAYSTLYHFILDHVRNCDASDAYEVPSYEIIKKWFEESEGDEAVLAVLEKIRLQPPYIGQDYRKILKQYKLELDQQRLDQILVNTEKISKVGLKDGKSKTAPLLKGIPDALDYFARTSRRLRQNIIGLKLESQIISKEDAKEIKDDYEKVRKDPMEVLGVYTGLDPIDKKCKGLKNTELMLVTAFTSQGKTTFSMYMAYKAIISGFNTAVITLEQSFKEIRQQIYVKHTCNPKFEKSHPQYKNLIGNISVEQVSYGGLTQDEQDFFFAASDDLSETEGYGKFELWQPPKAQITIADIEFKLMQIQQEYKSTGRDLEFVVIDYISLLGLPPEERTRDTNENQNTIIKQLKRLCLTFNNGKGLRIISPFQANRKGWEEAKANDGVYQLTALSNAHEAERSADVVVALFIDESWRDEGKVKISCLKNRRHPFFKPFNAKINFKSLFYAESNFSEDMDEIEAVERIQSVIQR
jgi:replicative DNA helicase